MYVLYMFLRGPLLRGSLKVPMMQGTGVRVKGCVSPSPATPGSRSCEFSVGPANNSRSVSFQDFYLEEWAQPLEDLNFQRVR